MSYVFAERPIPLKGSAAKILSGILPAAKCRVFIARPHSIDVGGIIELPREIYTKRKLRPNQKIITEQSGKSYRFHDAGENAGVDRRVSAYPAVVPYHYFVPGHANQPKSRNQDPQKNNSNGSQIQ